MLRFKRLRYFAGAGLSFLRAMPMSLMAAIMEPVGLRIWPNEIRKGISIVDVSRDTMPGFVRAIDEALTLVEQNDPLRFRRLQREIRTILNIPVITGAAYSRPYRTCRIDLRCFPVERDRESAIVLLALTLIHEATHGYLHSRNVLQNKRNYARVEYLCRKEESRFARKMGLELNNWEARGSDAVPPKYGEVLKFGRNEIRRLRD